MIDGGQHQIPILSAQAIIKFLLSGSTEVAHGGEDAGNLEVPVVLLLDAFDRFEQICQAKDAGRFQLDGEDHVGRCNQAVYRQVADARRVVDENVLVGLIDRFQNFLQAEKPIRRIGLQGGFHLQHLLPVGRDEVNIPGIDGNICVGDDFENGALGVQHQQAGDVIVGAYVSLLALSKETARQGNIGIGLLVQVYDKDPPGS